MPFLPPTMFQRSIPLGLEQRYVSATAGTAQDFNLTIGVVPNPQLLSNGAFLNSVRGGFKPERMQVLAHLFMNDGASVLGSTAHSFDLRVNVYRGGVYQGAIAYYSLGVSTTLGTAIGASAVGTYQAVTPASMAGIVPGTWLRIDANAAGQEDVMVASVTATTFTALFLKQHTTAATVQTSLGQYVATPFTLCDTMQPGGTTGINAVGSAGAASVALASPYGVHAGDQLDCDASASEETVTVTSVATVNTTSGTAVGAAGAATITPGSMVGIVVGAPLNVDAAASAETVIVTAVTATTFTATFAKTHTSGFRIQSDYFTATFAKTHSAGFTIKAAPGMGALANGAPFELQEGDVLSLSRVSSDLTGLASPAGSFQQEWRGSERKL